MSDALLMHESQWGEPYLLCHVSQDWINIKFSIKYVQVVFQEGAF